MEKRNQKLIKWLLLFLALFAILGIFFIGDISLAEARLHFHDSLYFVKRQTFWLVLSLITLGLLWQLPVTFWRRASLIFYLLSVLGLGLVLIPGIGKEIWGAHRWLAIGSLAFQPAELMKLAFLLYLSILLSRQGKISLKVFLSILLLPIALIALEPDLGTIIILVSLAGAMYFVAGVRWHLFIILLFLSLTAGGIFIFSSSYRRQRLQGFFDPFADPLNKTYHAYQLVLTLHRGGFWGSGLGQSRQKYQNLPQVTTDSILAVIGEEIGFAGLTVILILYLLGIYLIFFLAAKSNNPLTYYYGVGFGSWLATQGFLNAGAVAIVLPFTGVPFPLISYGGSSLVSIVLGVGLFLKFLTTTT